MDNKITIGLKDKLLEDNPDLNCINNDDECIICSQILKNSTDLILVNNLCKCYEAVKICEDCFVKWTSHNDECFFCRKRIEKKNFEPHQKILELNIETDEINEEDLPEDIRILRNRNLFTSFRTFKLWLNINSCTLIRYLTCYGFIGFGLYTVKHTIDLQTDIGSNSTNVIL
mgnify:FL=1|tara:strand:+ start:1643 stop:2158 length:516 start_codon:yes stop_codon:yes gene_type:complete